MTALQGVVADCEVNEKSFTVQNCRGTLRADLKEKYRKREKKLEEALDTLSVAFSDPDLKLRIATLDFLTSFSYHLTNTGSNAYAFKKEGALRLLKAMEGIREEPFLARLAPVVTFIMTLVELDEALFSFAKTRGKHVITGVVHSAMRFGRMRVFPRIQEFARSEEPLFIEAAVHAPLEMPEPTDDERRILCPWAEPFLTHDRGGVFREAGLMMIRCGAGTIERLLVEGEKRLLKKKFSRDDYQVFREVCFKPIRGLEKNNRLCDRTYLFLEQVARTEAIDAELRALALDAIYYQRRDQKTMDLLKTWSHHKEPKIQEMVQKDMASLKKMYKCR